eukprot:TRINITY_DN661_c0_g1_i2.p1 TRINITY_DN661_c0_g1~~TRINITY_DN661_c0_g1_i2.p1  ORF type:complete len:233 (-),score=-0.43 TRINITY_DN661_c0_g1_i2:156-854(-)
MRHFLVSFTISLPSILFIMASAQNRPEWPSEWQTTFGESFNGSQKAYSTYGKYYYSYSALSQRVDRDDGQGDAFCGSVKPGESAACIQLTTQGKRYIIYPRTKECCLCCTKEHGCGFLSPDWLDDAKYHGRRGTSGLEWDIWSIPDGQSIDYYLEAIRGEKKQPLGLTMELIDAMLFDQEDYKDVVDASVFAIPDYCSKENLCDVKSKCGAFREGRAERQINQLLIVVQEVV